MIKNKIVKIKKKYNKELNDDNIIVKPNFWDVPTRQSINIELVNYSTH